MASKRFLTTRVIELVIGIGFFYSALQFAMLFRAAWLFVIGAFLSLPIGILMGVTLTKSLRLMVEDGTISFLDRWQAFCGPRKIYLIVYISCVSGFALSIISFLYVFSSFEHSSAILKGEHDTLSLLLTLSTAVLSSIGATLWLLVNSLELRWSYMYEKQNGVKLYTKVRE